MSSLWTPYGEHEPEPDEARGRTAAPGAGPGQDVGPIPGPAPGDAEPTEAELREAMARLAATPVADIIANHVIGLWQLAVLHLGLSGETPTDLEQARLAIDAVAALVEGLGDRLGEHAPALRDALAQLRLAYAQVAQGAGAPAGDGS